MPLNPQNIGNGQEQYDLYKIGKHAGRKLAGQQRCQYDYRHTNGKLFSCVASTLEEARVRRDKWLEAKENA